MRDVGGSRFPSSKLHENVGGAFPGSVLQPVAWKAIGWPAAVEVGIALAVAGSAETNS